MRIAVPTSSATNGDMSERGEIVNVWTATAAGLYGLPRPSRRTSRPTTHLRSLNGAQGTSAPTSRSGSHRAQPRVDPAFDVRHHHFLPDIVEQIVIIPLVELECLVGRTGGIEEKLAATWFRRLVRGAVENEQRQCDTRKFPLETVVRARHLSDGLRGLRFVRDEPILVHRTIHSRVASEGFILEMQHVRVSRDLGQPPDDA